MFSRSLLRAFLSIMILGRCTSSLEKPIPVDPIERFEKFAKPAIKKKRALPDEVVQVNPLSDEESSGEEEKFADDSPLRGERRLKFSNLRVDYKVRNTDSAFAPVSGLIKLSIPMIFMDDKEKGYKAYYRYSFKYSFHEGQWQLIGGGQEQPIIERCPEAFRAIFLENGNAFDAKVLDCFSWQEL